MTRSSRLGSNPIGMLTTPALAVTALVITTLLTAGCTATVGGTATADPAPVPSEGPGSDPVAWADRVCEAVLSFAGPATTAPDFSTTNNLPAVQQAVSTYLDTVVTGARQSQARLAEVGAAPEPEGDEAVRRAQDALRALEGEFGGVKATVDDMNPDNPEAVIATLTQVESTVAAVTPPHPFGDLTAAPRLYRAAERSVQCQRLSALAADAPR